jgi:peptide/nickel transport system substrate-binding protein
MSPLVDLPHHFPEHIAQTMMFDSLLQFMPDGSLSPKLAQSYETSADKLSYTFKLDPRAKWWDGTPVTADDVVFTFQTLLDPKSGASDEGAAGISAVEASDKATVKVTAKSFDPTLLPQMAARGIVPKAALAGKDVANDEFNKKPLGSGPYKFVKWEKGQYLQLEANSNYFLGAPKIAKVTIKFLAEQNTMVQEFKSGAINYALLQPRDLGTVQAALLVENPTPRFFDIAPNYKRILGDLALREAVLYGTNRESIVQNILKGKGTVVEANVSPTGWAWAYNPETPKRPYDAEKAKKLLDDAGWKAGASGLREKAGKPLTFSVLVNNFDFTLQQVLQAQQSDLKKIGVDMKIEVVDPGKFGQRRSAGDFDALTRVWNPVYDPDQGGLLRSTIYGDDGKVKSGNFYGYQNPKIDELQKTAVSTDDKAIQAKAYFEIEKLYAQDATRLPLYTEVELHAFNQKIDGVKPHPVNIFWNLREWSMVK